MCSLLYILLCTQDRVSHSEMEQPEKARDVDLHVHPGVAQVLDGGRVSCEGSVQQVNAAFGRHDWELGKSMVPHSSEGPDFRER